MTLLTDGTEQQGMSMMVVMPPRAAAAEPVTKFSLWLKP